VTEITSETYPQKVDGQELASPISSVKTVRGPNFFKWGDHVPFERIWTVIRLETEGARLLLTCTTRTFRNSRTWTHETCMHQFRVDPDVADRSLASRYLNSQGRLLLPTPVPPGRPAGLDAAMKSNCIPDAHPVIPTPPRSSIWTSPVTRMTATRLVF
jgi:hypothetical protein